MKIKIILFRIAYINVILYFCAYLTAFFDNFFIITYLGGDASQAGVSILFTSNIDPEVLPAEGIIRFSHIRWQI